MAAGELLQVPREAFALDALDSYADHPDDLDDLDDLDRLVPNPAEACANDQVAGAHADLIGAHADMADALYAAIIKVGQPGNNGKATVDPAAQTELVVAKGA